MSLKSPSPGTTIALRALDVYRGGNMRALRTEQGLQQVHQKVRWATHSASKREVSTDPTPTDLQSIYSADRAT